MTTKLSLATLDALSPEVSVPSYARADLTAGIVHIGVGNFHRAHLAVYLDRLFETGQGHDWAILGAGVKQYDAKRRDALEAQDWLTTVVELDPDRLSARVTGAMVGFAPVDGAAVVAALSDPAIRIASLTVTEGGYFVDARSGGFDADHPEIVADVAAPGAPQTVFGILIAGLRARRDAGTAPFTIMSCDNLPENGDVAKQAVVGLARMMDPALADWIEAEVAFPNGMVDCITPATSPSEIAMVAERFGIDDAAPVTCEPFRQWVLEDHFPTGRPPLEEVGVEFVDDVRPHELMKLRILNGGHASIAYPGALLGHDLVADTMADGDVAAWYRALARREIIPTLGPIAGVDYDAYLETCVDRFSNTAVRDTIPRLCLDGSNRQPKFILPTAADALARDLPVAGLALEVALWCRYCAAGAAGEVVIEDERADILMAAAARSREEPGAFLAIEDVFGALGRDARFSDAFADAIAGVWRDGARSAIRGYAADG